MYNKFQIRNQKLEIPKDGCALKRFFGANLGCYPDSRDGVTFMELIIYVAISMGVMLAAITLVWNVMASEVKVDISTELTQNARLVMEKFTQSTQEAESINDGNSSFGSHPSALYLDYQDSADDITIDTYEKIVTVADQPVTIRKIRYKEGAGDYVDITSDDVQVINFVLTDLSRDEAQNVKMELTLEYINVSELFPWNTTVELETSASIRER